MVNSSNTEELGDCLVNDLKTVLDGSFGYKGRFAYSENWHPDAPSPLLTITDIGPIDLPLSEIDAKRIIACATQAPFGLGTSTVVDKKVRDTWQIDPSLVSFQNPAWNSFLQSNTANICSGLGLPGGYDIQYKLHKLLLYETGSHFRPHQESVFSQPFAMLFMNDNQQYAERGRDVCHYGHRPSFSVYWREIVVSHGSASEVIDVSASCTSISVLSWYTDVMHEVKPITSGYRLVLSYNLMRHSLSRPDVVSTRRNASELSLLHQIFERWRTGGYRRLPEQRMIAYPLGHQYSESDLDMGKDGLKGQDAHKVNQICWVAEMLGFELRLAKLQLNIVFEVEDDSGEEETWIPERWIERDCTLEYFTDLKGNRVHGQINHFSGLIYGDDGDDYVGDPDDQEFQRSTYKGNEPTTMSNYYHRTALVIFNKEDMDRVMIIVCGVEYGLDKLQPSLKQDNATPEDRKIIDLLLQDTGMEANNWKDLADFPLRWHDIDLWNQIIFRAIRDCYRPLIILKEQMLLAWDIFGFQQVQSSCDAISKGYDGDTIDFIHEVKARAARLDEQRIVAWCDKHILAFVEGSNLALSFDSMKSAKIIISIAKEDGIRFLKNLGKRSHEYMEIARLFMSEKENIYASPSNEPGRNKGEDLNRIFEDLLDKCIRGAIQELHNGAYLPSTEDSRRSQIDEILELMELCITTNRVEEYVTSLFRLIRNAKNDPLQKLMLYYIPITIRLRTRLPELGTSLLSPPFATFAQNVIGYYSSLMLGSKTDNPRLSPQMPPCNESCSTCASLHKFLEQLYVPVQDFSASRKTREHFVKVLSKLSNFISFTEVTGGRYRVGKHREFLDSGRWEYRLEKARDLLKSIGDDEFIEQLMGDRFEDLKVALEGKSSYNFTDYE